MSTKTWNDLADLSVSTQQSYENLLLVDGNNLAYRWLHRANYNNFGEDFKRTIQSLARSYEAIRTVVCFDFGKSYFRMDMFDEYKQNRKKPKEEEEIKKYEEFFAVLNNLPDELSEEQALRLAASTWPDDVRQCCHYSESRAREYQDDKIRAQAHSDYIRDEINTYGMDLDIVVEAKAKELAVLEHRSLYKQEKRPIMAALS